MRRLWLLVVLLSFSGRSCAQAPGDADPFCTETLPSAGVNILDYAHDIKPLMDSRHYQELLPPNPGAVWQTVDNNRIDTTTNWIQATNLTCRQNVTVCGFSASRQGNWIITQHISRVVNSTALQQVSVQVDFTLNSCTEMNNCTRRFSIHKYETSTINATAARTLSNYQIVSLISPRDVFTPTVRENASVEMNFGRGETGFYLGIQERDSCITINRLLVFYYVCPAMTDDLVTHPETIAPVIGDSTPIEVNGTCVENASPENGAGPRLTCSQSGDWSENNGDGCVCNPEFLPSSDGCSCEEVPLSPGVIIGVTSGVIVTLLCCIGALVFAVVYFRERKQHDICAKYGASSNLSYSETLRNLPTKDMPKKLIISSRSIRLLDAVGQGEFGIVYKAHWVKIGQLNPGIVAVKTLKGFFDQNRVADMIKESVKMYGFEHPHVLSVIGVCVDAGPAPYIVMPFMANGSLLTYIKKEKMNLVVPIDSGDNQLATVARKRLTDMCIQIAKGMEYLTGKGIIHRDLAARNCMIDINFIIKVADFGLSESMYSATYFRQEKDRAVKLPVKWLSPEALTEGVFSEKSDVWSYGVTCWELFTGCKIPYPGVDPVTLPSFLESGNRLNKPNNAACSGDIYLIMFKCWYMDPNKRPTFSELTSLMSQNLASLAGYLDVCAFSELKAHAREDSNSDAEVKDKM